MDTGLVSSFTYKKREQLLHLLLQGNLGFSTIGLLLINKK